VVASWGLLGVEVSSSRWTEERSANRFTRCFRVDHLCTKQHHRVPQEAARSSGSASGASWVTGQASSAWASTSPLLPFQFKSPPLAVGWRLRMRSDLEANWRRTWSTSHAGDAQPARLLQAASRFAPGLRRLTERVGRRPPTPDKGRWRLPARTAQPGWRAQMGRNWKRIWLAQPFPARRPAAACRWQQARAGSGLARKLAARVVLLVKIRIREVEGLQPGAIEARCPWPAQPADCCHFVTWALSWSASMAVLSSGA